MDFLVTKGCLERRHNAVSAAAKCHLHQGLGTTIQPGTVCQVGGAQNFHALTSRTMASSTIGLKQGLTLGRQILVDGFLTTQTAHIMRHLLYAFLSDYSTPCRHHGVTAIGKGFLDPVFHRRASRDRSDWESRCCPGLPSHDRLSSYWQTGAVPSSVPSRPWPTLQWTCGQFCIQGRELLLSFIDFFFPLIGGGPPEQSLKGS
jgi:hypothetical protein